MSAVKKTRQPKSSSKKHVRRSNPMRTQKKGKRIAFQRTGDGPVGIGDNNG